MRTTLCDDIARGWTLPQIARRRRVPIRAVREAAGLCRDEPDEKFIPSRQQIDDATAAMRATWSDAERHLRESRFPYDPTEAIRAGELVTTRVACRYLGRSRRQLGRIVEAGGLSCVRISHGGRDYLHFLADDLARYSRRKLPQLESVHAYAAGRQGFEPGSAANTYHGDPNDDV